MKTITITFAVLLICFTAFSQKGETISYSINDQSEMTRGLITNQLDFTAKNESPGSDIDNYTYIIQRNENVYKQPNYDYTLTPKTGKMYKKKAVIDLQKYSSEDVVIGLVTHTLVPEERYIEQRKQEDMVEVTSVQVALNEDHPMPYDLTEKELANGTSAFANTPDELKVGEMNPIEFVEDAVYYQNITPSEVLIINEKGEYLYQDNFDLIGTTEQIERFKDGKPITETTFYYKAVDASLIDESNINLLDFKQMTKEEQAGLINMNTLANN